MKKIISIAIILIVLLLSGCNDKTSKQADKPGGLSGDKPPNVSLKINGEIYETTIGSYCWESDSKGSAECIDTAGAVDLLKDREPIQVQSGELVTLVMDYEPKPNDIYLTETKESVEHKIKDFDNEFVAPKEKGVYFYDYKVWWIDENDDKLSLGDAHYAFVIEVQ